MKELYSSDFQDFGDGVFIVEEGSAIIQTVVRPWHSKDTVVHCFAYVVQGAEINATLMQYLLKKNTTLRFGAFGLTFDDTIIFSHSIAGANIDRNELQGTIETVARITDFYDDEIVTQFGGMTARQAMNKGEI